MSTAFYFVGKHWRRSPGGRGQLSPHSALSLSAAAARDVSIVPRAPKGRSGPVQDSESSSARRLGRLWGILFSPAAWARRRAWATAARAARGPRAPEEGGNQEVIRGPQRQSRGRQRQSRGPQRSSEAIKRSSEAIKRSSEVLRGNQEVLRGHQRPSRRSGPSRTLTGFGFGRAEK